MKCLTCHVAADGLFGDEHVTQSATESLLSSRGGGERLLEEARPHDVDIVYPNSHTVVVPSQAREDPESWVCPHCGAVLPLKRREAHLARWCPHSSPDTRDDHEADEVLDDNDIDDYADEDAASEL